MQKVYKNSKAGISLITVLLFMMIATIAATATYKWITSEGRSSASRMLQREAYQSSIAGIENARAWMTYHANDVGALIKAYIDGGNKPVNIDDRLRTLQREGQDYHVWLVGVNTEKSTYKLKILSSGEARNNTRHSEVAIFNVDGLYQVKVPQEKKTANLDFKFAYFGGSTDFKNTSAKVSAAIVNGNLSGSEMTNSELLVVTGNVDNGGTNNVALAQDNCIGGNLNLTQEGLKEAGNIYIHGNATGFEIKQAINGDVYFNGNVEYEGNTKIQMNNMTLNGVLSSDSKTDFSVNNDMCLTETGKIIFSRNDTKYFQVTGNVWMPGELPLWSENDDNVYDRVTLGTTTESQVYIKNAHPWSDYDKLRNDRSFHELSRYATPSGHPKKCSGDNQRCTQQLWWDGLTYKPYPEIDKKNDKYYIYYMPDGWTDVTFGRYQDNYWIWPGDDEGTRMNSYFVNYPGTPNTNGKSDFDGKYAFTDSWHTNSEGKTNDGYRYLNYNGNAPTASPYCTKANEWQPKCGVRPWFKIMGKLEQFPTDGEKPENLTCAQDIKDKCDEYFKEEKAGCDNSKFKIDDILTTAVDAFSATSLVSQCVKDILETTDQNKYNNGAGVNELNKCYASTQAEEKYNGEYLVIITTAAEMAKRFAGANYAFNGKFIFYITGKDLSMKIAGTQDEDDFVFMYLKDGAKSIQQDNNGTHRFFIYSEGDIENIGSNHGAWNGSIYMAASTCAKVGTFSSGGAPELQYNENLIKNLTDNGIICPASVGSSCGGSSGGTESGSGSGSSESLLTETGYDKYFISMAPQLGITLESQYENNESLPIANNETELNPSFIVLPRVIYLPSDPYGELPDYYNVLPLNGSALQKEDVSVSCSGIPSSGKLYNDGTPLNKGKFKCEASAANHDKVPFWVVVGEDQRSTPAINFVEPSHEMPASGSHEVKVNVPAHDQPIKLNVSCPSAPENWSYSLASGTNDDNGKCIFDLPANNASSQVTLFTVTTTSAASGTLVFNLLSGEGYNLTSP
ncbi:MAG: hypothetical protein UIH18_02065, partial [Fibrobacteraceae bacterium]|nr:hypothetical protein [Fibrobacteraceae bacterium]